MIYLVGPYAYQETFLVTDDLNRAKEVLREEGDGPGGWSISEWDLSTGKRTGRMFHLCEGDVVETSGATPKK